MSLGRSGQDWDLPEHLGVAPNSFSKGSLDSIGVSQSIHTNYQNGRGKGMSDVKWYEADDGGLHQVRGQRVTVT